jgi:hypothetical protein
MSSNNESTESVIDKDNFERGMEECRQSRKQSCSRFPVLAEDVFRESYTYILQHKDDKQQSRSSLLPTHHAGPRKDVIAIPARHNDSVHLIFERWSKKTKKLSVWQCWSVIQGPEQQGHRCLYRQVAQALLDTEIFKILFVLRRLLGSTSPPIQTHWHFTPTTAAQLARISFPFLWSKWAKCTSWAE